MFKKYGDVECPESNVFEFNNTADSLKPFLEKIGGSALLNAPMSIDTNEII